MSKSQRTFRSAIRQKISYSVKVGKVGKGEESDKISCQGQPTPFSTSNLASIGFSYLSFIIKSEENKYSDHVNVLIYHLC